MFWRSNRCVLGQQGPPSEVWKDLVYLEGRIGRYAVKQNRPAISFFVIELEPVPVRPTEYCDNGAAQVSVQDERAALSVTSDRTSALPGTVSVSCSGCGEPGSTRMFEFIPLWGFQVFLWYAMRRVDCRSCGVTVERVPWADGKNTTCNAYRLFLAL